MMSKAVLAGKGYLRKKEMGFECGTFVFMK